MSFSSGSCGNCYYFGDGENGIVIDAGVSLRRLKRAMEENGLTLEITQEARELLVKEGRDTRYGARPLRRAVRKMLEDPVSDLYLAGRFKAGDTICASVGEGGRIVFTPKKVEVVVTHEEIHPAEVNNGQNQN